MKGLLRLYPAAWRERYGAEVERLVDESGDRSIGTSLDLIRGAIDVRRYPAHYGIPVGGVGRWFTADHIAGVVAALGSILWLIAYIGLGAFGLAPWDHYDGRPFALVAVAGPVFATAFVLLSRGHLRGPTHRAATLCAAGLMGIGSVALTATLAIRAVDPAIGVMPSLGDPAADSFALGAFLLGATVGAATMWGRGPASRRSLLLLAFACVLATAFHAIWFSVGLTYQVTSGAGIAVGILFGIGWLAVGCSAMRRPTPVHRGGVTPTSGFAATPAEPG